MSAVPVPVSVWLGLRARSESSAATRQRTKNTEPEGSEDEAATTPARFRLELLRSMVASELRLQRDEPAGGHRIGISLSCRSDDAPLLQIQIEVPRIQHGERPMPHSLNTHIRESAPPASLCYTAKNKLKTKTIEMLYV